MFASQYNNGSNRKDKVEGREVEGQVWTIDISIKRFLG